MVLFLLKCWYILTMISVKLKLCHSFRQFYCLKPVYDSFGHFGCLKPVYDKMVYASLYHSIYHPLSETAGPEKHQLDHFYPSALPAGGVLCCFGQRLARPVTGSRLWGMHITETAGWIFSIQSYKELCNIVDMVICPFAPYEHADGAKTCQIWYLLGPDFEECISQKLLDKFTSMGCSRPVVVTSCSYAHLSNKWAHKPDQISLKPLNGFSWFGILWNCLKL